MTKKETKKLPKKNVRPKHSRSTLSTAKKRERFLERFAISGNVTYSAQIAGIERTSHYLWLNKDESYAEKFASAREEAADRLEAEAERRAAHGVSEPVFYQGEICGHIQRYSDVLLIFLLKATRPEKFREKMGVELGLDKETRDEFAAAADKFTEGISRLSARTATKQDPGQDP